MGGSQIAHTAAQGFPVDNDVGYRHNEGGDGKPEVDIAPFALG